MGGRLPSVVRKNLLLTCWLALPILIFAGLIVWIFVSAGRPKAMNAEAVGQGAGDTGGANALGEWIAGRNPNDVERANIARRERRPIDPFVWPGGTEVIVEHDAGAPVSFGWVDAGTGLLRSQVLTYRDDAWRAVLIEHRPSPGVPVYVSVGDMSQRIRGDERAVIGADGGALRARSIGGVVPEGTPASEPLALVIDLRG